MNKLYYFLPAFFLLTCAPQILNSCLVTKINGVYMVKCPDGSSTEFKDGQNGHSVVFNIASAAKTQCVNGGSILLIATDKNDNAIYDNEDTNVQSAVICNGANGSDGTNGTNGTNAPPTPFTPVGLIDPCGNAPNIYDEVFLKLADGTLLASFSDNANGKNTRFSIITSGNYMTTDGSNCYFSVDNNGNIYNEHY